MAKLGSFYSLCPLIDNKNLLDVSDDPEEGIVIVTLGKNLASRYKISDQKQITCWRTKEKFSSPVIYHKRKCKYMAVFNQLYVKFWDTDDSLDKLKKYKFNKPIHTLIKMNENVFIVFQNGSIYNLDDVVEDRKTLNPEILKLKLIDHVLYEQLDNQFYLGLVSENVLYWTKFEHNKCKFSKIHLERNDISIRGFVFHNIRNVIHLLTLWSDGSMYSRPLSDPNLEEESIGELFTVVDSISSKHFVSMKSLDENYIALYGANSNDEGAILTLYNIQFKVTQSKQPFKLFTTNSKIWGIENNLLIPVGQNLAIVPFRLETEQLAALVGSHKDIYTDLDPDIKIIQELEVVSWAGKSGNDRQLPNDLKNKLDQFVKQGLSESTILEELLPEIFEKNESKLLILMLNHFSDIPEKYLVQMINYSLTLAVNSKILTHVLRRPFSDVLILPHLRTELSLDIISNLLKYLHTLWANNQTLPGLSYVETHSKLLEWNCAIIDANYQKIVLSNDPLLIETLSKLSALVQDYLISLESLQAVVPLLSTVKKNKTVDICLDVSNLRYSIEQISLY